MFFLPDVLNHILCAAFRPQVRLNEQVCFVFWVALGFKRLRFKYLVELTKPQQSDCLKKKKNVKN